MTLAPAITVAATSSHRRWPTLGKWGATALLAACFTLSYVDRQVMSLLVTPVKAAFGASDGDIGVLQGVSFSLFYVAASLPLAWLADRADRARLAAICIVVWSLISFACGLSQSFAQLSLARIGLAVAEAGLPPAALTLMADLHDRRGLARATSLFMLAPFVGGGLALFIGGGLYAGLAATPLPWGLSGWQALFMLAGIPGLVLAPLVIGLLRDPRQAQASGKPQVRAEGLLAFLRAEWRFCLPYMLALALAVTVLNAHIAWLPSAILRRFAVGEGVMGSSFGIVYLVAGALGTLGAGWNLARGAEANMLGRATGQMQVAACLLAPAALLVPFAPSLVITLLLAAVAIFCTSALLSMGSLPFQLAAPLGLRARLIALSGLVASLIGTGLGPLAVGLASDAAARAGVAEPLSVALALVGGAAAIAAALLMTVARRGALSLAAPPQTI